MSKCVKCGNKSEYRLTIDIDIKGIPVCKKCTKNVQFDFNMAFWEGDFTKFEKKYGLK
jgi:NAD-dependent SIR2 family protein deacetylase